MPERSIREMPRVLTLMFQDHTTAWRRLRELHGRAVDEPDWDPKVVDPKIGQEAAREAYWKSLGTVLGSMVIAPLGARRSMADSLARFVREGGGTGGLEAPILSTLNGLLGTGSRGYDALIESMRLVDGFSGPLSAGGRGSIFMDVRDRSISFVGEDFLTKGFEAITAVIGVPEASGPVGDGPAGGAKSNDPALVGMDAKGAEVVCDWAGWTIGGLVGLGFALAAGAASVPTGGAAFYVFAGSVALSVKASETFANQVCTYIVENEPAPSVAQQTDPPTQSEESTTMPNPVDDGVPVVDLEHVQRIIEAHGPRTADDGEGRSFWTNGDFIHFPEDLVLDPPPEEFKWSLDYPVNLDAVLWSEKRPVNPKVGSAAYAGEGNPPSVMVVSGAMQMPLVQGDDGQARFPLP